MSNGILSAHSISALVSNGAITSNHKALGKGQIQPASLDLRLGQKAYRLRASFLPGESRSIEDCLNDVSMHEINLKDGAVLETGCVYLVPLLEGLSLPKHLSAAANPKSSTGRLDVFTRVICDGCSQFDAISHGYKGPLYLEIAPRTFSILVRTGDRLAQIRFRDGEQKILSTETVSIDLKGDGNDAIIGYRARRHSGLVDVAHVDGHIAKDYWQPIYAPDETLILDPNEFYILVSKESVMIPADQAAEMAPIATEIGEFRAHYAGFFDPGFGTGGQGSKAVLEVRGRDVPFMLRHGQPVAKLVFESMQSTPDVLYGQNGSNYQGQALRLSKHFKM